MSLLFSIAFPVYLSIKRRVLELGESFDSSSVVIRRTNFVAKAELFLIFSKGIRNFFISTLECKHIKNDLLDNLTRRYK